MHLGDIPGLDLHLDDQIELFRHDIHERFARPHHAPDRGNLEIDHLARGRGGNLETLEAQPRGPDFFLDFIDGLPGFLEFRVGAFRVFVAQVDDAQFQFALPLLEFRLLRLQSIQRPLRIGILLPQHQQLILFQILAGAEGFASGHPLGFQSQTLPGGGNLRHHAGFFLARMANFIVDDADLVVQCLAARGEHGLFVGQHFPQFGVGMRHQFFRKDQVFVELLLGQQAGLPGQFGVQLIIEDGQVGPDLGVLQHQQHLPGLHVIALMHKDLFDEPPLQMLHGLALAVHLDAAIRHHGAADRRQIAPGQKPAQKDHDHEHHRPNQPGRFAAVVIRDADHHQASAAGKRVGGACPR